MRFSLCVDWFGLLEECGLASPAEYEEMQYLGDLYPGGEAGFFSWDNLKAHLDSASRVTPERLRTLCEDLCRRKDWYAAKATDEGKFSNALAKFIVGLAKEGRHKYDDLFEIQDVAASFSGTEVATASSENVFPQGTQHDAHKNVSAILQSAHHRDNNDPDHRAHHLKREIL